jgi:hypothetical protein
MTTRPLDLGSSHPSAMSSSSTILARDDHRQSKSRNPQVNIAFSDLEDIKLLYPAHSPLTRSTRSSIASHTSKVSPLEDVARVQHSADASKSPRQGKTQSFLDKCKIPPFITRSRTSSVTSVYGQPGSPLVSAKVRRPSVATSNSNLSCITTSTTNQEKGHKRVVSQDIFEALYSNGASSPFPTVIKAEQQYLDGHEMDGSFPQAPKKNSPTRQLRRNSIASRSMSVSSKIGGWFSGSRAGSISKPASSLPLPPPPPPPRPPRSPPPQASIAPEDPLRSHSIDSALFPLGPVDPLDPTAFHDLLSNATSIISTFQGIYNASFSEVHYLHNEIVMQKDEVEQADTRTQHLKLQLDEVAAQLAVQRQKSDMLEHMLKEEQSRRKKSEENQESNRFGAQPFKVEEEGVSPKAAHRRSDSGFESDGSSIYSVHPQTFKSPNIVSVEKEDDSLQVQEIECEETKEHPAHVAASCQNCTGALNTSTLGNTDLQTENQQLKIRVLELEIAVDSCMDMISDPWR